jgi:putative tributyrin esterase
VALLRCDFFSETLSLSTSMNVLLPQRTTSQVGLAGVATDAPPPVLYLLHGMSDDATTWVRRTSIERYVAPLGLAVVMPQVHRSYYTDEAYGGRFWTFLSEELPALVQDFFRVSERREDTFVAGLSMGGYGALKWALREPHRFAAAASLSGALDVAGRTTGRDRPEDPRMTERIFGDADVAGSDADLLHLVSESDPAKLPALRAWCGLEDGLLEDNRRFAAACAAADLPFELVEGPGDHDWAYWDDRIRDVLDWLPLEHQSVR